MLKNVCCLKYLLWKLRRCIRFSISLRKRIIAGNAFSATNFSIIHWKSFWQTHTLLNISNAEKSTDRDAGGKLPLVKVKVKGNQWWWLPHCYLLLAHGIRQALWRVHSLLEPKIHSPICSKADSAPSSHWKEGELTLNLKEDELTLSFKES